MTAIAHIQSIKIAIKDLIVSYLQGSKLLLPFLEHNGWLFQLQVQLDCHQRTVQMYEDESRSCFQHLILEV